ncbi:MAG: hypothetical protein II452_04750 [Paludibacteraceae bacterium]|nr:hypothetical protein [Paludibacteraceae bacterium]
MRKFLSLTVAVFMAAMTFGQSYGILVNGTTYYAGSAVGEYEGFTQYLAHVPLQAGDYCQLYDADNEAAWAVTLNTYSVAGFTKNNDRYDVSVSGCYDFYIKLKYGADELYIGTGSDCGEGVVIGGEEEQTGGPLYLWDGIGVTKAADAKEVGGAAEAVQADGTNIAVGVSQKGNWCLKANKGFNSGAYYLGIALENAVNAGDTIRIAYFRTTENNTYVLGMDFSADKASAASTYQILTTGDPQVLASNGTPADSIYIVPEGVANAKYVRLYRNSGSTGLWIAKFELTKKTETPEPPVEDPAKFYVTGDSALMADAADDATLAWNPAAIKAEADTLVLNLLAEQAYKLKVTLDGQWATAKGYEDLTEKPAGVSTDNDGNILFSLAEAGAVKVIYTAELFKVEGNFYVEPVGNPAKFYVTGDSALVTDAGFPGKAWSPAAIKSEADTLPLSLKAGQTYSLKITLNGEWATAKGYNDLTEKPNGTSADNDGNIVFALTEAGIVNVIYIAGEEPVFKIEGSFVENEPQPIVENGFYLVGSMNEWTAAAAYLFTVNPENENEYALDVNLTEGDELKVKKVEAGQPDVWYPGEGDNYVVDANHAGATTMYFQVDYKEEWAAFGGYFYIVPTSTVDITNTNADVKVVKVLRNGQLLIIKGENTYNAQGAVVK